MSPPFDAAQWPSDHQSLSALTDDSVADAYVIDAAGTIDPLSYSSDPTGFHPGDGRPPTASYACYCYDFVVEAVFMGALCLFGFAGNTVATLCLRRDRSKTATPFLLVSLEVADTLFLVAVFGLRVLTSIDTFALRLRWLDPAVPFIGKFVYPTALVAETGTIYLTILVTVNRYISVCWPYRASDWCSVRCARRHVAAVVVFSVAFNVPRFFEYDIVQVEPSSAGNITSNVGNRSVDGTAVVSEQLTSAASTSAVALLHQLQQQQQRMRLAPSDSTESVTSTLATIGVIEKDESESHLLLHISSMAEHPIYRLVYSNILYFFVMFLFPLASLTFLNQRLIVALRRTKKKRQRLIGKGTAGFGGSSKTAPNATSGSGNGGGGGGGSSDANRSEEDITFMLIVVVMVFVVTQTPAAVTQMMESWLDEESLGCPAAYFFYVRISDLLVVANSSLNFVVYCLCSRRFRQILIDVVCRCPLSPGINDEAPDAGGRRGTIANGGLDQRRRSRTTWSARGQPAVDRDVLQARRGTTASAAARLDATAAAPLTGSVPDNSDVIISRV